MGNANQSVENDSRPISKVAAAGKQGTGGKTQHRVSMRWQPELFTVCGSRRGRGIATKALLPRGAHCFGVRPYLASPFEGRSAKVGAAAGSCASESAGNAASSDYKKRFVTGEIRGLAAGCSVLLAQCQARSALCRARKSASGRRIHRNSRGLWRLLHGRADLRSGRSKTIDSRIMR